MKRAKTAAHPTTTIGTIGSAASSTIPASVKSRATTREELRTKLAADARRAELLRTEVDTMGEDWLLALQDELTKPYFLTVRPYLPVCNGCQVTFGRHCSCSSHGHTNVSRCHG